MTDTPEDTGEWLTTPDTLTATVALGGVKREIKVRDISRDRLEALEERLGGDADAQDQAVREAIREYLVEPAVDPDEMPMAKRQAVWLAIQKVWSGADEVRSAMDELQVPGDEGK